MDILILYATLEGQTKKIAKRIAQELHNKGHQVGIYSSKQLPPDFAIGSYDAAILGGSIHMGNYPKSLKKFVQQYHNWLNDHPSALFTVCMAINSQRPKSRLEANAYAEKFTTETQWHPTHTATFAGAIKYKKYGILTRYIMRWIAKREGGSTDTSRDHEYTNWDAVVLFTDQFVAKQ